MRCPVCESEGKMISYKPERNVLFCISCERIYTLDRSTNISEIVAFIYTLGHSGYLNNNVKAINVIPLGM